MKLSLPSTNTWRGSLIAGYATIVLLLSAVWLFSLLGPVSNALEDRQREGLVSVANATEVALASSDLPVQDVLNRIATSDHLRLTLISADGSVLADSTKSTELASHAERPEVVAALKGELGSDRRVSETDGIEYLYVAVPSSARPEASVLRVSMPVTQAHASIMQFRWTSFALLGASLALAVGTSLYSFTRTAKPVSRLERVRTDFVANASHELKTPVAGIRLLSESISHACEDGDLEVAATFATRLSHESERLQNLVTDLMDLSRIEDELRPSLATDTCDFESVVTTSFEAHRQKAQDSGLQFIFENALSAVADTRVRLSVANATLLVDNLIDNAIAYTEEGFVLVRLAPEKNAVVLEVQDTGIGIPPADQERVFERFYRVDTTRSRETGGTGLGLSLVRHAVNRGHGTIELESQLGQGSTFRVTLPTTENK